MLGLDLGGLPVELTFVVRADLESHLVAPDLEGALGDLYGFHELRDLGGLIAMLRLDGLFHQQRVTRFGHTAKLGRHLQDCGEDIGRQLALATAEEF